MGLYFPGLKYSEPKIRYVFGLLRLALKGTGVSALSSESFGTSRLLGVLTLSRARGNLFGFGVKSRSGSICIPSLDWVWLSLEFGKDDSASEEVGKDDSMSEEVGIA